MSATDISLLWISGRLWLGIFVISGLILFSYISYRRIKLLRAGKPENLFFMPVKRIKNLYWYFFLQKGLFKEKIAGMMHALIFWGFLVFIIRSLSFFMNGFAPDFEIPANGIWLLYYFTKDIFAVLVILAVLTAMFRRWVLHVKRLEYSFDANLILILILILMLTDLLIDGTKIEITGENLFAGFSPASSVTSEILHKISLSQNNLEFLFTYSWWLHALTLIFFLNYLPLSKHFHVLTSFFNVLFFDFTPRGEMEKLDVEGAFERNEVLGIAKISDLTWKDILDLYSCTECGRCTSVCPANISGKVLSPKDIILELRDQAYYESPVFSRWKEREEIIPKSVKEEEIWACTTCAACVEACPIQIDQPGKILEMRRNQVMMKDSYPKRFGGVFQGMERTGNPWGMPPHQRTEWIKELNVKILSRNPEVDILFFVGCSTAFDNRNQKIAKSMVKILNSANIDFGILGEEERCTGDSARRAGNEYLFQSMAKSNIETFNKYKFNRILTICPHCYNTLYNEYPQFGGEYEVVHHTEFIKELILERNVKLKSKIRNPKSEIVKVAYHDSCYLGRHNGIYSQPREILESIPGIRLLEIKESKEAGMCCGAGGGLMWLEEDKDKRVNERRLSQVSSVNPEILATACPFCMTMLEAGISTKNLELKDMDIAELVAEAMG